MHHFRDFKSFAEAELNLLQPVTILIGPNGSGKSNLIEGVELLAQVAHGRPLHEIADIGRGYAGALEIRGGLEACPREGRDSFALGFGAATRFRDTVSQPFRYEVSVAARPTPRITRERLVLRERGKFRDILATQAPQGSRPDDFVTVRYDNFRRGGNKPTARIRSDRSALSQYDAFATDNDQAEECSELVGTLRDHLRASFVFEPDPKAMRDYERIADQPLARNGANLSAVLFSLSKQGGGTGEVLARLQERIRQVPQEPFTEIDFVSTELNDVIFGFGQNGDGPMLDARMLSDGTLRCLAVLTALETAEEGSRIVIEELDNGLHPSRVQVLVQALYECAEERRLNVLATTHNPATLDALTGDRLGAVVVCTRDAPDGTSRLVRLKDMPRFIEFAERGKLGDLVTRRVIDQYLSSDSEEEHQRKMREWLEALA